MKKQQLKISLTSCKNYEVSGWVYDDELTDDQVKQLGIEIRKDCQEIEVVGEFSVEWDDDIPMVAIEYLELVHGDQTLTLKDTDYNYDKLCYEIEQSGYDLDWSADRACGFYSSDLD